MPDPTLRQLLEFSRPIQEFSQAIQGSLRLIQAAVAAEAGLENAKARTDAALKEAQTLETRKAALADDLQSTREAMLLPAKQELKRLEGEAVALRARIAQEKLSLDEERGRRTAILRSLDEQVDEAKKRANEHQVALKAQLAEADQRAKEALAAIQIRSEEATRDLERLKADYRAVQQAAAKLAGR